MAVARNHAREETVLSAWAEHDGGRALHAVDRDAIVATESARSLVLELLTSTETDGRGAEGRGADRPVGAGHVRDLFNACARLGTLMAEAGASPSLAAGAIESAVRALEEGGVPHDGSRVAAARASLIEGYVAAVRDAERAAARAAWEYPACVVRVDDASVAIACGHPTDDAEALAGWAARIAGRLVKAKIRTAVLDGNELAKAEVGSALELVGIRIGPPAVEGAKPGPPSEPRSWLRLPWRK